MTIDVGQIHNLVRTYQRALNDQKESREPEPPATSQSDSVSISEQARRHVEQSSRRGKKA
jgi:hypothetical protein